MDTFSLLVTTSTFSLLFLLLLLYMCKQLVQTKEHFIVYRWYIRNFISKSQRLRAYLSYTTFKYFYVFVFEILCITVLCCFYLFFLLFLIELYTDSPFIKITIQFT